MAAVASTEDCPLHVEISRLMATINPPRRERPQGIPFLCLLSLILCSHILVAQEHDANVDLSKLRWSTDSTGPRRFVAVHGRRAAIFGYLQSGANDGSNYGSNDGLEVWAYPIQILSAYSVALRRTGESTAIDGQTILRRIDYSPESVTRIYAGPDYLVRETLFVPLDESGACITYEVEGYGTGSVDIEIRFTPALDLMWPAAIGGQETLWDSAASSYVLTELTHRFVASIGSPEIVAHDDTQNISKRLGREPGLAFTIRAGVKGKAAHVIIAASGKKEDLAALSERLLAESASLEKLARDHYQELLSHSLQVETPDTEINRAIAWSEIALDQAWVCNADIGCGIVAGYGPSRRARRPQYDWFFAGDGMVAIQGLLVAGEYARAREELEFILKYQDHKTGMIWHEMSQSAGLLDWAKYPYMFAHVDLTFQFLSTTENYFSVTGDSDFVKAHWAELQSAYDYCRKTLDALDGLPRIPADKEGGREQDALSDEMMLSASWVSAAQAFAKLASATGHRVEATQAGAASDAARKAIRKRYWNASERSWITGFTRGGSPLIAHDIGPVRIGKALFSAQERESMLDEISSPDFQADWGTRGNSARATTYDPNSYASGSVWATSTAEIASVFWSEHRPVTALPIWNALVPWSSFDSLGHLHEAMAGDFYHEELESVPEQTWSSSSFFISAVHGLLGLEIDAQSNRLTFAPHLPAAWNGIGVKNVRVGRSILNLKMVQSSDEIKLQITNPGGPVRVVFNPEIPLGAELKRAELANLPAKVTLEKNPEDTHARIEFDASHGTTYLTIGYSGGVAMILDSPDYRLGDFSRAIKIASVNLKGNVYTISFAYPPSTATGFKLRTPWAIKTVDGATVEALSSELYRVTVVPSDGQKEQQNGYKQSNIVLTFATAESK